MTEREEIDLLKKSLSDLRQDCKDQEMKFLKLLLDIGGIRRDIRDNRASIARVSSFFGGRSVEFRDRITALETRFFKTIGDFAEVERIIGKADDTGPNAAN